MLGMHLSKELVSRGYKVSHLGRKSQNPEPFETFQWDPEQGFIDERAFENLDYIIHLAGASIAEKRWTNRRKRELYDSRIKSAELIFEQLKKKKKKISAFISASAIGIYGYDTGDKLMREEDDIPANDFLSDLVNEWEMAADQFRDIGARVVKIRVGLVLSANGGLLEKLLPFVKYGFAAPFGHGRQFMSWIHIEDLVNIFVDALENHIINGTYNAVAPDPVTNTTLIKTLAQIQNKPYFLPGIPKVLLNLALGEMANAIAGGNKVSCKKIMDTGFRFKYPELEQALRNLLHK